MTDRLSTLDHKQIEIDTLKSAATYEGISKALEMVRDFIIQKRLILYGGMAIDMALRLKGDKLYDDDEIPDYDVLSPTPRMHAIELGRALCRKGYKKVSVIQARHHTTFRIGINFEYIFDITYVPKEIYDYIPHLVVDNKNISKKGCKKCALPKSFMNIINNHKGMRVIHPNYQKMDMHFALLRPMSGWQSNANHRWKKDMTRYEMLESMYPVKKLYVEAANQPNIDFSIMSDAEKAITTSWRIPVYKTQYLFAGIVGYAALYDIYTKLAEKCHFSGGFSGMIHTSFEKKGEVIVIHMQEKEKNIPAIYGVDILSDDVDKFLKTNNFEGENLNKFYPLLTLFNEHYMWVDENNANNDVRVYNIKNDQVSYYDYKGMKFVNPQFLLYSALTRFYLPYEGERTDTRHPFFIKLYLSIKNMIESISNEIQKNTKLVTEQASKIGIPHLGEVIYPSINVFGKTNIDEASLRAIRIKEAAINNDKTSKLSIGKNIKINLFLYESCNEEAQPFDPKDEYHIDGTLIVDR